MTPKEELEKIARIAEDPESALFEHIEENEEAHNSFSQEISALDEKIESIKEINKGEKGDKGDRGVDGKDGKDGKDGEDGYTPIKGVDYFDGKDGEDGVKGDKGDKGDKIRHKWKGTKLYLENQDGTFDKGVDLKGDKGFAGLPGISLGASYPALRKDGQLITTGFRQLDFQGAFDVSLIGAEAKITFNDTEYNLDAFELELTRMNSGNSYMEYTEAGGLITQVDYWTDSGKGTKLFTKEITYSGSNPTVVTVTNELNSKVLTTTIAYSGETITSVTKVIT